MKYEKLFILSVLIHVSLQLRSQTEIGLGVEYGRNWLTNVNPNKLSLYGHSGQQSNQQGSTSLQPFIIINKKLWRNFDIEFGAGYSKVSHSFDFNYTHSWYGLSIDTTVTFTDQWLVLPVNLGYNLSINQNSRLRLGIGVRAQFLLKGEDNYMKTVFETVEITAFHTQQTLVPEAVLGYKRYLNTRFSFHTGGFVNYNLYPMTTPKFGFYENISKAKNLQCGIFFKIHYKMSKK